MRYHKAGGRTLRMLMDDAMPRRADGAIALCQHCQRRAWYAGSYVELLANQLAYLAKAVARIQDFRRALAHLDIGQFLAITTPCRGRAIAAAKDVAEDRCWAIRIQTRGHECLRVTRMPYPAQGMSAGTAKTEGLGATPASPVGSADAPELNPAIAVSDTPAARLKGNL